MIIRARREMWAERGRSRRTRAAGSRCASAWARARVEQRLGREGPQQREVAGPCSCMPVNRPSTTRGRKRAPTRRSVGPGAGSTRSRHGPPRSPRARARRWCRRRRRAGRRALGGARLRGADGRRGNVEALGQRQAASSAASPVEERPAAWVSDATAHAAAREAARGARQVSGRPADGSSTAQGARRTGLHVPQRERRAVEVRVLHRPPLAVERRPERAPAVEAQLDESRRARADGVTTASSPTVRRRSPGASGGGAGRCSVGVRQSPAPNSTARQRVDRRRCARTSRPPTAQAAARRASRPLQPRSDAGSVAASLTTSRSPARRSCGQIAHARVVEGPRRRGSTRAGAPLGPSRGQVAAASRAPTAGRLDARAVGHRSGAPTSIATMRAATTRRIAQASRGRRRASRRRACACPSRPGRRSGSARPCPRARRPRCASGDRAPPSRRRRRPSAGTRRPPRRS